MMNIILNKTVKVGENNGSMRMSLPNMVHSILEINPGDKICYKSMKYDSNLEETYILLQILKKEKNN